MKKTLAIIFGFLFLYGLIVFTAMRFRDSDKHELSDAQKYAIAQGFPPGVVEVIPFSPKIHIEFRNKSLVIDSGGSGVLVRTNKATEYGRVFTAAHLFYKYKENLCSKELFTKLTFEKDEFSGKVVYYEPDKDIAVIEFSPSSELRDKGVFLAREDPQIGEDLFIFGYVEAKQGVILRAPFIHEFLVDEEKFSKFLLNESIAYGFSGGPLLNQSGELVGANIEVFPRGPFSLAVQRKFLEEAGKEIDLGKKICK